ncbi:MAG: zonular occludens toxin domain-containing protein, partial [Planctomycetaceae bacterium]|nr:zonular occludens toxin domain-containing protein [Planctomycetaceae bacterium]
PLDIDEINRYLTNILGTEIDLSEQLEIIDETFFCDKNKVYRNWWEEFTDAAFVVIDEVHHFLPANLKSDKAGKTLAKEFTNYVSTHRHRQHDLIFLTQHLNNITPEVKRMAEVIYEVLNVKNMSLGIWPFIVQMSDIDTVREAWGYPVQLAHIKRGVCSANSVEYDKACEQFVLSPSLFGMYRSHTLSGESFDRPSLKLGKIGSLFWLFRKYFFKFAMYAIVLVTLFIVGRKAFMGLPDTLSRALVGGMPVKVESTVQSDVSLPTKATVSGDPHGHHIHIDSEGLLEPLPEFFDPTTDDIVGFLPGGVITKKGILKQNDHIIYKGERDYVKQVDVMRGILYLGSGKKVQK